MKSIKLTQGQVTWVDDWNYEWLNSFVWDAWWSKKCQGYYVRRWVVVNGKRKSIYMHSLIMKTPKGMHTDHINGDTLFNLESNLRICTPAENSRNSRTPKNNTSGYKGVTWHKKAGKWLAQIMYNRKNLYLGLFSNPIDAAKEYDKRAKELFGEFAQLNFSGEK